MMTNEQKIRILRLHAMGMGYAAIGKEVGIKRDTIKSFISRNKNALLTTRCDFCGRKIVQVPKQKPKRFCSDQCRMKWWSSHQEEINRKCVEVYFEKENIYTLDSKGELLITIMSSIAQEESRSISENVTWGQRKRFSDGKVSLPYKKFLGYEKGEDGYPKAVEEEAKVVRMIYRLFLEGETPSGICHILMAQGIPSPGGGDKWHKSTIYSILTNEKYKGDALLQKKFTIDFLSKKQKINEGEVPQYYVEGSHEAIVSPQVFDLVQFEIQRRKELPTKYSAVNPFSSRIL